MLSVFCFFFFFSFFFFFNDTATTEIYTLSLHDALPICRWRTWFQPMCGTFWPPGDRKSTRLNSSHPSISYAVFCLKKKKKTTIIHHQKPKHVTNTTKTQPRQTQ